MFLRTQERIAAERGDLGAHSVGGAVSDDLKFWVAPTWWRVNRDRVWGAIFIGCLLVASFIPNNAERQEDVQILLPRAVPAASAPYIPCAKTQQGKQLHAEIAHWRKDGWVISCYYRGIMTRDEAQL